MIITLNPKHRFRVPVDADCITTDVFLEKTTREIAKLQVFEGNRQRKLGELFRIENRKGNDSNSDELTIQLYGDLSKVRRIGARMSAGTIKVDGHVGMHLGKEMKGGTIVVTGQADSWAGSIMRNGTIEIKGNAGDYIGASYRGSGRGMRGGTIIVHGNAGNEVGCFMRKGLIKIYGSVGQFLGVHMRKGTVFVKGNSQGRAGAEMTGGKIVVGGHVPSILPTFTIDSVKPKVKVNGDEVVGPFYRFVGDLADRGSGKLYVSQTENAHLKHYEQYL